MRPGRPLRPALAGWRLGIGAIGVIAIPIVVAVLLLTEFNVLRDEGEDTPLLSDVPAESETTPVNDEPDVAAPAAEAAEQADAPVEEEPDGVPPAAETEAALYIVVPGDTLASIARRFERDIFAVAAYNGLADINRLDVGQEIRIPPPDFVAPEPDPVATEADAAEDGEADLTPAETSPPGTSPTQ